MRPADPATSARREGWLRAAVLGVLLLAAAFRWAQPGLVEFKYDEANITRMALGLAGGGPLPLLSGGTTLGVQRPGAGRVPDGASAGLDRAAHRGSRVGAGRAGGDRRGPDVRPGQANSRGQRVGLMAALVHGDQPVAGGLRPQAVGAHPGGLQRAALDAGLGRDRAQGPVGGLLVSRLWLPCRCWPTSLAVVQALSWLGAFLVAPRRWWRRETGLGLLVGAGSCPPYVVALAVRWAAHGAGAAATAIPPVSDSAAQGASGDPRRLAAGVLPVYRRRYQ